MSNVLGLEPKTEVNLNELANGALLERVNNDLQKIMENIYDPNTDATKARKLNITISLTPDKNREVIATDINTKITLASSVSVSTTMLLGKDTQTGKVVGRELASGAKGQTYFDASGVIRNDEGKPIEEVEAENTTETSKIARFK
ncbi:replication terminator protein (plasmid) [Lysinibacillus capsici]|uniref:replication terminator protein n=1 Tax=Lysinibacillus capsici TaxID=2115968 RepID=UPI0021D80D35|nr:replication terminator protein [Lysinibacillus capsici]UYB50417.1 replication terminator protein [Lysinibacillus capsici]